MPENYYLMLGVSPQATISEIKRAYRRLAKQYHPDHHGPDSVPFLTIREAYSVLSDPVRKKSYDRSLRDRIQSRSSREAVGKYSPDEFEPLVPVRRQHGGTTISRAGPGSTPTAFAGPLFDLLAGRFPRSLRYRTADPTSPHLVVPLTPSQALQGGQVRLRIPGILRCPSCRGWGVVHGTACRRCAGRGTVTTTYPVTVRFPPGIPDNYTVRVILPPTGMGNRVLRVRFKLL